MIDTTTVSRSFIKWMQDNGYGIFGTDIFLNQIPELNDANEPINNAWWVVTAGGDVVARMVTAQSIQQFSSQVFYRNISGDDVESKLFEFNQKINARGSFNIDGFEIYSIEATMPEDGDRDAESRRQGSLVVAIEIYQSYVS